MVLQLDFHEAIGQKSDNWVPLLQQPSFTPRKLRLVCVGAGFAGLMLSYKIKHELSWKHLIDLQIFEKNADIGGTWYENRYPGAACDIPAHVYVFPFEPNPNWSSFYAGSGEIWQYMKDTATKHGLEEFVSLRSKVTEAIWDEDSGKWKLKIERRGEVIEDECDVLINGSGVLNKWAWPQIKGLSNFKGKLLHTADWDTSYDWAGKRVAVVGNGSSAIQVVPQIQPTAQKLVNYMRNPTWISTNFSEDLAPDNDNKQNFTYSETQRKEFRETPEVFLKFRKQLEHSTNQLFHAMIDGSPGQKALQESTTKVTWERLNGNEDLIKNFVPNFKAGCRRLTPGDGYLEALQKENVSPCWSPIVEVTEKGIRTEQGEEEFDLIVCATGFDLSFRPSWNMTGRNGVRLQEEWKTDPLGAYLGIHVVDHPNYFMYMGPYSPVAHGVLLSAMYEMTNYILKWCWKIATEDIKSVSLKAKVMDDFDVMSQEILKQTVWADECRSWYKNGKVVGKITACYPGSAIHYREMLQELRGENFDFTYRSSNRFRFLGNGMAKKDAEGNDLSYYLTK